MKHRLDYLTTALGLILLLLVGGCSEDTHAPDGTKSPGCANTFPQQVFELINQERAAFELAPLAADVRLAAAAQAHSEDMAANDFMSHTGSNGSSPFDRMHAAGYEYTSAGENVAAGYSTPASVVAAWMDSPGHRANILRESFEQMGVGFAEAAGTRYTYYWTVAFGAAQDGGQVLATGCHP